MTKQNFHNWHISKLICCILLLCNLLHLEGRQVICNVWKMCHQIRATEIKTNKWLRIHISNKKNCQDLHFYENVNVDDKNEMSVGFTYKHVFVCNLPGAWRIKSLLLTVWLFFSDKSGFHRRKKSLLNSIGKAKSQWKALIEWGSGRKHHVYCVLSFQHSDLPLKLVEIDYTTDIWAAKGLFTC